MHDSIHMAKDMVNAKLSELRRITYILFYTVSQKKTSEIIFVTTTWNFHQISWYLAQRWETVENYTTCTHFPPHL